MNFIFKDYVNASSLFSKRSILLENIKLCDKHLNTRGNNIFKVSDYIFLLKKKKNFNLELNKVNKAIKTYYYSRNKTLF